MVSVIFGSKNIMTPLKEAQSVFRLLKKKHKKIVFAESCTGGMMASIVTEIHGISENFCGSLVVYRNDTKTKWLKISKKILAQHDTVSVQTAKAMAKQVLVRTPEADLAVAITGYLGPKAPKKQLGHVFVCVCQKSPKIEKMSEFWILPKSDLLKKTHSKKIQNQRNHRLRRLRVRRRTIASLLAFRVVRSLLR
ncbi:MAG: CinA family protein [Bdellovibrio sp.]|nr:CinA family protein [Bdellovibrio sp.]